MKQSSHIGNQAWSAIPDFFETHDVSSVLLVTGKSAYASSGAQEALEPLLRRQRVRRVCEFETNPKTEDVTRILKELREDAPFDCILAVGGGSVIDVAKLLKAFLGSSQSIETYLQGAETLEPSDIPLIAVPSTAGSGSEATHFAVVYQGKEKFSVAHERLLPNLAVVVPALLKSLPAHVAAASGMDALCQGIESYWSIYSTDESRDLAREAVVLAWGSLKKSVLNKDDQALEDIARASHLAGQAINITKTTAPHAVSYALTSFYGITHGHAVGLLVARFFAYNSEVSDEDCLDSRGPAWVKSRIEDLVGILSSESIQDVAPAMNRLMDDIGLEVDLKALGLSTDKDIEVIVENGFNPQRVNNNPRRLDQLGLSDLLLKKF